MAIADFKYSKSKSIKEAARVYNVLLLTFKNRLNGKGL